MGNIQILIDNYLNTDVGLLWERSCAVARSVGCRGEPLASWFTLHWPSSLNSVSDYLTIDYVYICVRTVFVH